MWSLLLFTTIPKWDKSCMNIYTVKSLYYDTCQYLVATNQIKSTSYKIETALIKEEQLIIFNCILKSV